MEKRELNKIQGARLKECIDSFGITQKRLAELSNYTPQFISNVIKGTRNMSYESAEIFAKILNVNRDFLLGKDNVKDNFQRQKLMRTFSDEYDRTVANLLFIAAGIGVSPEMLAKLDSQKEEAILLNELRLYASDGEIVGKKIQISNNEVIPKELILKVTFNGKEKYINRQKVYDLQKDIMDYAEFKCNKFIEKEFRG